MTEQAPLAAVEASRSTGRRAFWCGLLVVLCVAGAVFFDRLDEPFGDSHDGWGGAFYSIAARNYLRHGPATLGFAMCCEAGSLAANPDFYVNHPPMIAWVIGLGFAVFGEAEWVARMFPALWSMLAMVLFYLLVGNVLSGPGPGRGDSARVWLLAGLAVVLAGTTPAWAFYGDLVDPQGAGVLFAEAGALWSIERWWRMRRRRDFAACLGCLVFGCLIDWPVFLVAGFVGVWIILAIGWRSGWRPAVLIWGAGLLLGASLILWANQQSGRPILMVALQLRTGLLDGTGGYRDFLSAVLGHHRTGFFWPVSVLGLLAWGVLLFAAVRRRVPANTALLCVPLAVGLLHVALFLHGAAAHEFWQIYLAPGLALPLGWAAFAIAARSTALRSYVVAVAVILGGSVCVLGALDAQERTRARSGSAGSFQRALAADLRARTTADETILLTTHGSVAVAFYADRKLLGGRRDLDALRKGLTLLRGPAGGLVCTRGQIATFASFAAGQGWSEPVPIAGGLWFFDAVR